MMTLVLYTHMKLKAGMVERKITAAKAKCRTARARNRCTADSLLIGVGSRRRSAN